MSLSYWLASARWSVIEGTIPSLMSVSGLPVRNNFVQMTAHFNMSDGSILLLIMLVEWKARTVRQMDMRMYWRRFK